MNQLKKIFVNNDSSLITVSAGNPISDPQAKWEYGTSEDLINQKFAVKEEEIDDKIEEQDEAISGYDQRINLLQNDMIEVSDKAYDASTYSGLGRKLLKKNIVNNVNMLTLEMVNDANTIYVIQYDFVLGENITVPANCVLEFDGGSISAGSGENMDTITGNNTGIQAGLVKIFNTDVTLGGSWNVAEAYPEWFGAKGDDSTDSTVAIQKTFNTKIPCKFSSSTYLISDTLYFYNSFFGVSQTSSMIKCTESFPRTKHIIVKHNSSRRENIEICNIKIESTKVYGEAQSSSCVIYADGSHFIQIHNVVIKHSLNHGICLSNVLDFIISENTIFDCKGDGVCILYGSSKGTICGNEINQCFIGIELEGRQDTTIYRQSNITVANNSITTGTFTGGIPNNDAIANIGILLIGAENCSVVGNSIEQIALTGIKIIASKNVNISNNVIKHIHEPHITDYENYFNPEHPQYHYNGIDLTVEGFEERNHNIIVNNNNISNCETGINSNGWSLNFTPDSCTYDSTNGILSCNVESTCVVDEEVAIIVNNIDVEKGIVLSNNGSVVTIKTSAQSAKTIVKCHTNISIQNNNISFCYSILKAVNTYWLLCKNNIYHDFVQDIKDNIGEALIIGFIESGIYDSGWLKGSYNADMETYPGFRFDVSNPPIAKVMLRNNADNTIVYNSQYELKTKMNVGNVLSVVINIPTNASIPENNLYYRYII